MTTTRILSPADRPAIEAFLAQRADTTLFLQSNLALAGLGQDGHPFQGVYAAAIHDHGFTSMAAHYNGGNVVVSGDLGLEESACAAVSASGRPVRGVVGVWSEALRAHAALDNGAPLSLRSREGLYAVDLSALVVPQNLRSGDVVCRASQPGDLDLLAEWRALFSQESLGQTIDRKARVAARASVETAHRLGRQWVLVDHAGQKLATSAFNAATEECVQVGGVYTPPDGRGRGYARCVVAGSLLSAAEGGASRSILFTGERNFAAQRAYSALGYQRIGEYGLLLR